MSDLDMELTDEVTQRLSAHFPESIIKERPGGKGKVFRYIESRDVMNRLTEVVGKNWTVTYSQPYHSVIPGMVAMQAFLTVCGVTRCAYGESSFEMGPEKAVESDALKRAGVTFGIGRYLYEDEDQDVQYPSDRSYQDSHQASPPQYQQHPTPAPQPSGYDPGPSYDNDPEAFQAQRPAVIPPAAALGMGRTNDQNFIPATEPQFKAIFAIGQAAGLTPEEVDAIATQKTRRPVNQLSKREASTFIDQLKNGSQQAVRN